MAIAGCVRFCNRASSTSVGTHKKEGLGLYPHGAETRALRKLTNFSCKQSDASLRIVPGLISFANTGHSETLTSNSTSKPTGIGKRVQPAQAARLINRFATRNAIQPLHYAQQSFSYTESCSLSHVKRSA